MTRHYRKEILNNPYLIGGAAVSFESLDGNQGVISLDDQNPMQVPIIRGLDEAAAHRVGGIVRISAEEYSLLKKKFPASNVSKTEFPQNEQLRVMTPVLDPRRKKENVAADKPTPPPADTERVVPLAIQETGPTAPFRPSTKKGKLPPGP